MTDKRKRAAPTIDLKATEVPAAKPVSEQAAAVSAPAPEQQAKPAPPPPPPPPEPPRSDAPPPQNDFIKVYATPLAAAFAGALIGGALIWALLPGSSNDRAQIAALQKQIQDVQKRPPPDTQAVDALRQRLAKIEHDIANLPPGDATIADRLSAADSAMKSLGIALAALNKRNDDSVANAKQAEDRAAAAEKAVAELRDSVQSAKQQASAAVDAGQLAAVQQRIGALEQSMKDARAQIATNATTDKAARLALSAAALRDAIERGAPYREELAQAKALGADEAALAPLASFSEKGVPSGHALARELNDLISALIKAAGVQDAPGGFLDRLQANARKLVRVSPVNVPPGDKPSDVLARIEAASAHDDIAAALNDIGKLPEAARQKATDWVNKATARQKALAAARAFAADTARGLVSGPAR